MKIRTKIYNSLKKDMMFCQAEVQTNFIISEFEKIINKVERNYWKSLPNPYLRGLPMKVSFPKEMDALNKVRKEITKKGRKKK